MEQAFKESAAAAIWRTARMSGRGEEEERTSAFAIAMSAHAESLRTEASRVCTVEDERRLCH